LEIRRLASVRAPPHSLKIVYNAGQLAAQKMRRQQHMVSEAQSGGSEDGLSLLVDGMNHHPAMREILSRCLSIAAFFAATADDVASATSGGQANS
jgi:hypothetical protein